MRGELRLLSPASEWLMNIELWQRPEDPEAARRDQAFCTPTKRRPRLQERHARPHRERHAGEIVVRVGVSPDVPKGVILAHKGRWTANGADVNVNTLNPGQKSDLAESCAVHSINVSVVAA